MKTETPNLVKETGTLLRKWKGQWPSWFVSSPSHPAWYRKQTRACIKQMKEEEERLAACWKEPIQHVVEQTLDRWNRLSPMRLSPSWVSTLTHRWAHRYMEAMRKDVQRLGVVAERHLFTETKIRDELRGIINRRIRALPTFLPYLLHHVKQETTLQWMEFHHISQKEWHTHACTSPFCSVLAYERRGRNEAFLLEGQLIQVGSKALRVSRDLLHPPLYVGCRCELVPVLSTKGAHP
ncbi:hypothetical protein ACFQ5B_03860 [Laceyella putida]|uniref:Phage head morphogenesis domain-containing protein n=2 Tax=Laceyella putida TaxID=110101 RepID=A0ABW2RQT4_9BACL